MISKTMNDIIDFGFRKTWPKLRFKSSPMAQINEQLTKKEDNAKKKVSAHKLYCGFQFIKRLFKKKPHWGEYEETIMAVVLFLNLSHANLSINLDDKATVSRKHNSLLTCCSLGKWITAHF